MARIIDTLSIRVRMRIEMSLWDMCKLAILGYKSKSRKISIEEQLEHLGGLWKMKETKAG
jgi:hypothetical protein